jgi:hypothetical protein
MFGYYYKIIMNRLLLSFLICIVLISNASSGINEVESRLNSMGCKKPQLKTHILSTFKFISPKALENYTETRLGNIQIHKSRYLVSLKSVVEENYFDLELLIAIHSVDEKGQPDALQKAGIVQLELIGYNLK